MPADRQLLIEAEAVCVQAVRQAGAVLLDYFRQPLTVEFKEKGQQSPVTEADRRSEELLRAALTPGVSRAWDYWRGSGRRD